jgi:hypothetical protein
LGTVAVDGWLKTTASEDETGDCDVSAVGNMRITGNRGQNGWSLWSRIGRYLSHGPDCWDPPTCRVHCVSVGAGFAESPVPF